MFNTTIRAAEPGQTFTSRQIDDLFDVTGEGLMRTSPDHQVLVLIEDFDTAPATQGCLEFHAQSGNDQNESLAMMLENYPENGIELDLFSKTGDDQFVYLGRGERHDYQDGLRHHWMHESTALAGSDAMVFLIEPEMLPAPRTTATSFYEQDGSGMMDLDPEETEWNAATETFMEEFMQDDIWPVNSGRLPLEGLDLSGFWKQEHDQNDILVEEILLNEEEPSGFVDFASASHHIDLLAANHILKQSSAMEPEILILQDEEPDLDEHWSQWRH